MFHHGTRGRCVRLAGLEEAALAVNPQADRLEVIGPAEVIVLDTGSPVVPTSDRLDLRTSRDSIASGQALSHAS